MNGTILHFHSFGSQALELFVQRSVWNHTYLREINMNSIIYLVGLVVVVLAVLSLIGLG